MKKLILPLFLLFAGLSSFAQSHNDDIQVIQALYGKEKSELIKAYLNLSEADAAKFWPIYEAYEAERKALGKQRIENITKYVDTYGKADDATLDKLTMDNLKINTASDKLLAKYYGKIKKGVNTHTAAKFYQFETYMLLAVRESIWDNIPFIDELDN